MNKSNIPENTSETLGFLLWQTNMSWHKQTNRALDEIDLTHTQFAIMAALLSLLEGSNQVTQKDIAMKSNTDSMMVSKVLRTLQKKELIERKEHETDTRAKCVFLTKKGQRKVNAAFKIVMESNNSFFNKLSNKSKFKEELTRIIK